MCGNCDTCLLSVWNLVDCSVAGVAPNSDSALVNIADDYSSASQPAGTGKLAVCMISFCVGRKSCATRFVDVR